MAAILLMARTKKQSDALQAIVLAKYTAPNEVYFYIEDFIHKQRDQFAAIGNGEKKFAEWMFTIRSVEQGLKGIVNGNIPVLTNDKSLVKEAENLSAAATAVLDYLQSTPDDEDRLRTVAFRFGEEVYSAEEDCSRILEAYVSHCEQFAYRLLHPK